MNYEIHTNWWSKEETYNNAIKNKDYKIYGFDMDFEKQQELEYSILNNCIAKKGDVLFDISEIANRISTDRANETGDKYMGLVARFISMMFLQALVEDNLDEKLKYLLEEYIKNNKKYYNFKYKGSTMYREMYNSCMCYPEILFFLILENTKSDVLGQPLYLTYGRSRFCKTHYLKPTEDGTALIDCDAEDAKWAAGVYNTPEEIEKLKEEKKIIDDLFDKLESEGKTYEEIHEIIQKMREEGKLWI